MESTLEVSSSLARGARVKVTNIGNFAGWSWYPKGEVTGTVTKVFKATAYVAVDQMPNRSGDGKTTLSFPHGHLEVLQ